jgi:raffinose synthase
MKNDSLAVNGVGLVDPEQISTFYNELHRYLRDTGVDGVKVDAQAILETLGAAFGGRVTVTRKFQEALEASVASNFPDNGCIACMCHNTDTLYR